jgi:hypothetical protein
MDSITDCHEAAKYVVFLYNYGNMLMKATLLFKRKETVDLKSGETLALYMDCFQIDLLESGFEKAISFSWIVFDPSEPERRVLMDQHRGRPCHFHIGNDELILNPTPVSIDEALEVFWSEVVKYFGEVKRT